MNINQYLIPITLVLSGCAHQPFPTFTPQSDLIEYTAQFIAATPPTHGSTPLKSLFPDDPSIRADTNEYRRIHTSYCAVEFASNYLTQKLETRCKELDGEIIGNWCADIVTLKPLFKMYAKSSGKSELCPNNNINHEMANIDIIYPKTKGEAWDMAANKLGYLTKPYYLEKEAQRYAAQVNEQEKLKLQQLEKEKEEARIKKEKKEAFKETKIKMLTTRGLKICNYNLEPKTVYIGYIESAGNENIKIDVQAKMFRSQLTSRVEYIPDSSFKPQTIWDIPENWAICE